MKSLGVASILALALLSVTAAHPAAAQSPGAAAAGSFRFWMEDGFAKQADFSASTDPRGTTTGQLTFNDEATLPDVDDPEDPNPPPPPPQFRAYASFDTLKVDGYRGLMSGTVTDSTHRTYIGKWVQLVVEDNGADTSVPPGLTWTFCQPPTASWVPSDAELPADSGAYLSWWATDAERPDDVGIPSKSLLPGSQTSCDVYTLPRYTLADLLGWEGRISVHP